METISNNPNIKIDKLDDFVEQNDKVEESLAELSPKQERFLDLIDADNILPADWGSSKRPKISYFGIMSYEGTLPFNQDGRRIVHEVMAYDEKEYIVNSSRNWEKIAYYELLETEISDSQKNIENRRSRELGKVAGEKQKLNNLKNEFIDELEPSKKSRQAIGLVISKAKDRREDLPAETIAEYKEVDEIYKNIKNKWSSIKDSEFRAFLQRRGYKDEKIFEYLDERKERCGINYTPEFASRLDQHICQKMLNSLFEANKNIISISEKRTDGARTISSVSKKDEKGQAIEFEYRKAGRTLEELAQKISDVVGYDSRAEVEKISADMTKYIVTKERYDQRKNAWWSGGFAQVTTNKSQHYLKFSEINRVNSHFDKLLDNTVKNSQQKVGDMLVSFKNQLNRKLFGDNLANELYMLPTGIVAFRYDEKIVQEMPVFDESLNIFDDYITPNVWRNTWVQYVKQNMQNDLPKLAKGLDIRMSTESSNSPLKELFDNYNIKYNDRIINEETGYFVPNFGLYDREALVPFLDKYGKFISSAKCDNTNRRMGVDVRDWRKGLLKNIRSSNVQVPPFVKETFFDEEDGLTLNLDNIPANLSQDPEMFELAAQIAIWDKMDGDVKESYFNLMGERLNANQSVFVKLFGEFVYNAPMRRDLIARLMFLGQFKKWQENVLENDAEKEFFDLLEQNTKNNK